MNIDELEKLWNKPCPPHNTRFFDALVEDCVKLIFEKKAAYAFSKEQVAEIKKRCKCKLQKEEGGIFFLIP